MSDLLLAVAIIIGMVIIVFLLIPPMFALGLYIKQHPILGVPSRMCEQWSDYWFEVEQRLRDRQRNR